MTGGSLGIRSGSYGSLDKQLQNNNNNSSVINNGVLPIQSARKPSKMLKEKERLYHSICKFAGRKKVGMLLLCVISAAVFGWVLYVGKGLIPFAYLHVGFLKLVWLCFSCILVCVSLI